MLLALLIWIVVGGIAGWLASVVVQGGGMGILGDVLVGIVGAVIGSIVLGAIFGVSFTGFNVQSVLVAFIGAILLLLIVRFIEGRGHLIRRDYHHEHHT